MELISIHTQRNWSPSPVNGNDIHPHLTELIPIASKWNWYLHTFKGREPYSHWTELISITLNRTDLHIKCTCPQFPFNGLNRIGTINFIFSRTTEGERTCDRLCLFLKRTRRQKNSSALCLISKTQQIHIHLDLSYSPRWYGICFAFGTGLI
jgi:hypothetical protein